MKIRKTRKPPIPHNIQQPCFPLVSKTHRSSTAQARAAPITGMERQLTIRDAVEPSQQTKWKDSWFYVTRAA